MQKITILTETPKNPITFIGKMAGLCYGSDTDDDEKNYKRGLNCIKDGHGRTLEFAHIYMSIEGYSARTIRQLYTHIGGAPTRLQASTRYIDYSNYFNYVVPPTLKSEESIKEYAECMKNIQSAVTTLIKDYNIPKEDAALLLPLGMETEISVAYNARTIMSMAEQRLCSRTYWEFRMLMYELEKILRAYSEEWNTFCDYIFVCKCDKLKYCPENHGCGRWVTI